MSDNEQILSFLRQIVDRLDRLEMRLDEALGQSFQVEADNIIPMADVKPRGHKKVSSEHIAAVEETERHYFKHDILDRLDAYFEGLRIMRKIDPEAYTLYSAMGAPIVGKKVMLHYGDRLPASWRHNNIPAFGAVASLFQSMKNDEEQKRDDLSPDFIYFKRCSSLSPMVEFAKPGETVLDCTFLYLDRKSEKKVNFPISFHVAINPAADSIRLLRQLQNNAQYINPKRGRNREPYYIPRWVWGLPKSVRMWWDEKADKPAKNIHDFVSRTIVMAAHANENARLDVQVNVFKGSLTAVFAIDMLRTPYFFADRDVDTQDGTKRKIFHIVRAHERRMAGGNTKIIKSHFRGERSFSWNGYEVNITLAGKHHTDLLAADFGAHDEAGINDVGEMVSVDKVASMLRNQVRH